MGLLDKFKNTVSGNKSKAKQGVDAAADQTKKVAPDKHDKKVDKGADAANDAINKLD
ncbi:MAG TPA: Rv0909 family putative TA system antitoxin [Ilumatobacter sp.]|jgi:hypothetical protein|nr:Rv0909 family putative TA system antitoxin [Ilumatobacter sp.]